MPCDWQLRARELEEIAAKRAELRETGEDKEAQGRGCKRKCDTGAAAGQVGSGEGTPDFDVEELLKKAHG